MQPFIYNGLPSRVIFGAGSLDQLDREIDLLGARRALVLSTPQQRAQAEALAASLGSRAAGVYAEAVMHVPVETARAARDFAEQVGADCAIAIGGGSTTGLGKAIALDTVAADHRDSDHLRRLRDDADLRPHRERRQEDRPRSARAAEDGDLRPGADDDAAARAVADQRHQRNRPCSRRALRTGRESDRQSDGGRRHSRARSGIASRDAATGRSRRARRLSVRRLAVRRGARQCRHGACITSCATRSAAPSTCRMRRPTRSCCRTRSPTTARLRPMR